MKQLFAIDLHDYDGCTKFFRRPSARGIILDGGRIALVYSRKENYYKFPGGGIRPGEDKKTALVREVKEETGLTVIPESIAEFGSVMRRQRSNRSPGTVFEQENFYYVCRVEDTIAEQNLDDYEREAEFVLQFADIDEAIRVNEAFHSGEYFDEIMIKRDLRVLQMIREAAVNQALLPYAYVMEMFPKAGIYENEYASALDDLMKTFPGNRFLKELSSVSGAKESADALFAQNGSPVVAPDDFGRVFLRLLRSVYQKTELSAFTESTYRLWKTLPDGIMNTQPFLTLCYAGDALLSCDEKEQTRRNYENLFDYYNRKETGARITWRKN